MNSCHHIFDSICVDYRGNLIRCCDLAWVASGDGSPTRFGAEFLANLREVSLKEGLIRHFQGAASLAEAGSAVWTTGRTSPSASLLVL
jgi:hypothetical protein